MRRMVLSLITRAAITAFAFWWVLRLVDLNSLKQVLASADRFWLLASLGVFTLGQFGCIIRWGLLVPAHPSVRWPFLMDSFFVAQFFNMFLPTTVGGDVMRGYDLIKATGEWRPALASILVDRLVGFVGFLLFSLAAWMAFPAAREDPLVRSAFFGYCALVLVTFAVLGSRRVLQTMLRPFSKIGLGALQSHAKQFQEALRAYLQQPKRLLAAFGVTIFVQILAILIFAFASKALHLPIPLLYLVLIVPIIITLAQVPVSLNGWGIREGATVLFLGRIGIQAAQAFSLSLVCAVIPLLSGMAGAGLFLLRRQRKARKAV